MKLGWIYPRYVGPRLIILGVYWMGVYWMGGMLDLLHRDWILLQSMSLNPIDYGWTLCVHGYDPVPTLYPMAPGELVKFTSCNCHGYCINRGFCCKKNGVPCISACGVCKGITCRNINNDGVETGEDIDSDCLLWSTCRCESNLALSVI